MKIYLIKNNKIINEYNDVISWGYNFVEYNNGGRCKIYCAEDEYFTDNAEVENENN